MSTPINFSRSVLYEMNISFFNTGQIFTPEVFTLCKKVWRPKGAGAVNFNIPVSWIFHRTNIKFL